MPRLLVLVFALLACARTGARQPVTGAGDSLYAAGQYAAARAAYRADLRSAQASAVSRGHLLTSIALSSYWIGDYDEARRVADSAVALIGAAAPMAERFRANNASGLVAWKQGRLAAADTFFHTALRLASAAHDTSGVAKASANLALVLTDYGDFTGARSALLSAGVAAHSIANGKVEGNVYTNLAMLSLRTGDVAEAEEETRRALDVYRASRYETGTQAALGQLATIEAAKGDGQAAFAAIDSALVIVRREGLKQEEASDLEILGELYADAGDLRAAALYYEKAEREFTAAGDELEAANLMRARADLEAAHGDTSSARRHAGMALTIHKRLGARAEELNDRLAIADWSSPAQLAVSRELDSAAMLAGSLGSHAAEVRTHLARARYEERSGRAREVLRVLSSDLAKQQSLDHPSRWQVAALRLRAWTRLSQLDSAEAAGREAVRLVERSRGLYGSAELRTAYTARMAQVYTDLVLVLLREGHSAAAFEIADAARGRALVEHLASARDQLTGNTAPALFLNAELLARQIDSMVARLEAADRRQTTLRGIDESNVHRDLADRLARARAEYEAAIARGQSGDDAELLGLTTVNASRVQASLGPHEALLDYLVTRDTLFTFVVTRKEVRVARAAASESDVSARARILRELFGARVAPTNGAAAAQALFDLLIGPAQRTGVLRDVNRLVIVPHEALSYVPFAALRDPRNGNVLVEEYVIAYSPSAAALPILRERANVTQQGSTSSTTAEAVALAPFTSELPGTAAEARRFAARVPNAVVRLGSDATERQLRLALASGGVVHVATHAQLNVRNPMFSQIRLVPGSGARDDDGRLEVYEIFGMRVRSPLVFLSGCETGAGSAWSSDFQRGEDYATLARAFLYAGARNVVATLWPIDDEGAAELADKFYTYRHSADDADALARAQREMMRDARYQSPYYWAGYQLSGTAR